MNTSIHDVTLHKKCPHWGGYSLFRGAAASSVWLAAQGAGAGATVVTLGGRGAQKTSMSHLPPLFLDGGASHRYL